MTLLTKKPYEFDQYTAIRKYNLGILTFSPDSNQIAYAVNTTGHYNIWRQSVKGGYPIQVTNHFDKAVTILAWSPNSSWIAYNADFQGDEYYQVFLIPVEGGVPIQITDKEKVWHDFSPKSWSPDGKYLAYNANDRDPAAMDVLVHNVENNEVSRAIYGDEYFSFGNWAPDSTRLLAAEVKTLTDFDIWLIDLSSKEKKNLTSHDGEAIFLAGPWSPDGKGFYMRSDHEREFIGIAYYHLDNETWEWIETPDWDVIHLEGSTDGKYLSWVVNENGYSKLYLKDLIKKKTIKLPKIPKGAIWRIVFSPDGDKLGLLLSSPTHPSEIYILNISAKTLKQITHSMFGGIDEKDMLDPDLIHYPTFDDRNIPAWLYKPKNASSKRRVPVILSIHGGPEYQEFPTYIYSGMYQFWSNLGIGVLAPNIRGSTGYGKSYQKLIHKDWGGGDLKDVKAAVEYLHTLDWVDPDKIGLFGASYGGFMTLSAVSRLPDIWAAAVDIVGPSNLVTLIETGPPHWRKIDERTIGDPEKEYDFLMSRSPVTYADQIKAPLYIIQGGNDQRVPKTESDQMVKRLEELGVEVKYDIYEDEGHGFTSKENELKAWNDTSAFFRQYLLGE